MTVGVDWRCWTVILLKPDCLDRALVEPVLAQVATRVTLVDQRSVVATYQQILAHYEDLLTSRRSHFTWVDDMAGELHRIYAGRRVGLALGYGDHAAARVRDLLGDFDPAEADPATIRGRFGDDSLRRAQSEGRLIANLIHSSDDPAGAAREFGIWYGPAATPLLRSPNRPSAKESTRL
jgi:nucleoside-diphosphate kinase